MRISDWSSDVCSSDLQGHAVDSAACRSGRHHQRIAGDALLFHACDLDEGLAAVAVDPADRNGAAARTPRTARIIQYAADRGPAAKLIYARSCDAAGHRHGVADHRNDDAETGRAHV